MCRQAVLFAIGISSNQTPTPNQLNRLTYKLNLAAGSSLKKYLAAPLPPPPFGRSHRLGLPTVVCVECLPADKPWDVVSVTRRSSGVAPRACVRVYARVLVPPNLYIHAHTHT